MQEQLPTTARMQEIEQCRSNCRGASRNPTSWFRNVGLRSVELTRPTF
jgi:hypothetical protein